MRALLCAVVLAIASVPAVAQPYSADPYAPAFRPGYDGPATTGALGGPLPGARNSGDNYSTDAAADGNAEQLAKPTQNYGRVSGGYRNDQP